MPEIKRMCAVLKRNDYCSNNDSKLLLISEKENIQVGTLKLSAYCIGA